MNKVANFIAAYIGLWLLLVIVQAACNNSSSHPEKVSQSVPVPDAQARIIPDSEFCATIADRAPQRRAVGLKGKYWAPGQEIRIGFIGGSASRRKYVTDAFAQWSEVVNLKFTTPAQGPYEIMVAFASGAGSWSYVGTDCRGIAQSEPTMNIGWAGIDVALHEIGHALGMAHEQASPNQNLCWNKDVVYASLGAAPNYWDKATVDYNVFRKLSAAEAEATAWDPNSIMQYSIPATWLCPPAIGIPGGKALSDLDKQFMAAKYPKAAPPPVPPAAKTVTLPAAQRDSIVKWLNAAK